MTVTTPSRIAVNENQTQNLATVRFDWTADWLASSETSADWLTPTDLSAVELDEQSVGDEGDVLRHRGAVHADERARQRLGEELLLDGDGVADDRLHPLLTRRVSQVTEHQAREVRVQALCKHSATALI